MQSTKILREKLKEIIDTLSDEEIKRLWEEYEDLMIGRELDKDPKFLSDAQRALNGVDVVSHEDVKKELGL